MAEESIDLIDEEEEAEAYLLPGVPGATRIHKLLKEKGAGATMVLLSEVLGRPKGESYD